MNHALTITTLLTVLSGSSFAQSPATTTPTSQALPGQTLPGQTAPARSPLRAIGNTQYTPHTELFAEFRPLLVNVPARFTAHLTQVGETFKPYTQAEVTLTLTINGALAYQETLKQPVAPGIYRFPVKSEVAGTGKVTIALKMPTYSEEFMIENVTVYADEAAALAAGLGQITEPAVPGEVIYYKEKSWLETFATAPVSIVKKAILIPQTAIVTENGTSFVYVQSDPEHFRKQVVQTGQQQNNTIEVKSGLQAGNRIVTLGADKIK
jgi:multidrug efflux pump subunit AcrA (membrane-fusion protein)